MPHLVDNRLTKPLEKIPAAQYLRMSTEHQQYSPDNQAAAIQRYAAENGYNIVSTYSDEGKSGVTVGGRSGLLQLIEDVESGQCGFAAILVYDVSRWGRFQNPDEAAVYEVRCRWAGVPVHYCAEPFENDGSVISSLMKTLKRAMAAEYSRELSARVTEGHLRMLERGYHQGGFPCFGLQRVLIDADGRRKQILRFRERKSLQSDRVILEPGPQAHIDIVNEMYRRFLAGERQSALVAALNGRGDFQISGRPWTDGAMRRMLTSECYIGNIIWGKQDGKLGRSRRAVPKSNWVRREAAFPNVVELSLFQQVQAEIARRKNRYSSEEMLAGLRGLLKKHGTLNKAMINKAKGVASAPAIAKRFGSLKAAYETIGFRAVQSNKYTKIDNRISVIAGRLGSDFAKQLDGACLLQMGPTCRLDRGSAIAVVLLARYIDRMDGTAQWYVHWGKLELATIAVIGLMNARNTKVNAYYVIQETEIADLLKRRSRDDAACLHPFAQTDASTCISQVASHMVLMG